MLAWLARLDHATLVHLTPYRASWLDDLMLAVTDLGARGFVWVVIAVVASVFPARRADAWRSILTILVTFLVVDGMLKPVIWRDRPFDAFPDGWLIAARATTSSFPSGHAASAFAGALATSRVLPSGRALWFLLAVLIAYSRVYLGVHFPADVLAGGILGTLCGLFVLGGRRRRKTDPS